MEKKKICTWQIYFTNPETKEPDTTQVCAENKDEAMKWFRDDFCAGEGWDRHVAVDDIEATYNADDAEYYETEEPEYEYTLDIEWSYTDKGVL